MFEKSETYICECCGCVGEPGDVHETEDGHFYCDDCIYDAGYGWCDECETWVKTEHMVDVRMNWRSIKRVCVNCAEDPERFFRCDECEQYFLVDTFESVFVENIGYVCTDCFNDKWVECYHCGKIVLRDEAYEDNDTEAWYCESCAQAHRVIRNYNYKPKPRCKAKTKSNVIEFIYPEDSKELLLGAELEIDYGENQAKTALEINNASKDIYVKKDGSLEHNGLEIVTHPCTLEYHIEELGWDKICDIAKKNGYRSHDARTCGLHVHVGIHQLGKTDEEREKTIAKVVMLVDRHWPQMKQFSRRRRNQLNEWATPPNLELKSFNYWEDLAVTKALNGRNGGRYRAVNLTNNKTIEFRLFNGSLLPNTIIATLQLVSNICEYAKHNSVQTCLYSRWDELTEYKLYPELQVYLKSRGMTKEEERPALIMLRDKPEFEGGEIRVGDKVCAIAPGVSELYGTEGVVIYIQREYWDTYYLVDFRNRFCEDLHDCGGRLKTDTGYKFKREALAKLK